MALYELIFLLSGLTAVSQALPTSLLENIKDAQLQSPIRSNKVKRAQEFIMFGNQQNRAAPNFGNSRNEKRAYELNDNSLDDEELPLPNIAPSSSENVYDSNQLGNGKEYERAYPYLSRDLYYNMLLRNLKLMQTLHNEPAYNLEMPFYNIMDSRTKRATNLNKLKFNRSLRMKRNYPLSSEDLLAFMKMWENEKNNRKSSDFRNQFHWPIRENESDDYQEIDEDILPLSSEDSGSWYDGPVFNPNPSREREAFWPMSHKRFMENSQYTPIQSDGISVKQRFLL